MRLLAYELAILLSTVSCSPGDQHHTFVGCLDRCINEHHCPHRPFEAGWTLGSCFRCRHDCMWDTVSYFTNILNQRVPQFYGKWPFVAVQIPVLFPIPIQEISSVIFSLLNLLSTLYMYRSLKRLTDLSRMKTVWVIYSVIGIITCWSFVFIGFLHRYYVHIRGLMVFFDYGYNMKCCIIYSLTTAAIYYVWILWQWRQRTTAGRQPLRYLTAVVTWGLISVLFEVLDFVPIFWLIDAHSLFHLATIPMPVWMTRFIYSETAYEIRKLRENSKLL